MFELVRSDWATTLFVCAKCTKRAGGGFGRRGRTPLAKALRKALTPAQRDQFGVIAVKCLGVCPQSAITMIDSRSPREMMIVPVGTAVADVVAAVVRTEP